jgi:hypothetical protein
MDINILVVVTVFDLILVVLGLVGKKSHWAVFPWLGGIIQSYLAAGLLADGDITEISGGVQSVIATAGTASTWQAISVLAVVMPAGFFIVALLRTFKL